MDLVEHAKDEMKMIHVIRREKEKKIKMLYSMQRSLGI